MKLLLLLCALAMPLIAGLSERGLFGPTHATLSDSYPTLLAAAGYTVSIWWLICALDLLLGLRQFWQRRASESLRLARPSIAVGFALSAAWMVAFPMQYFMLALAILWGALACLLHAALPLMRERGAWGFRAALNLHAGWLSLAVFLNTAQVIVAHQLFNVERMLPWSLLLWGLAALLLFLLNRLLRGHWAYVAALLWGLLGVQLQQSRSSLAGADVSAGVALGLAALLALQTLWLWWQGWRGRRQRRGGEITLVNLR
ncbi:MAG TPA: hypothetical protein VJN44_00715 [Roseateles sp.]|nr:hypothetical protein [Roseateles sp.]